MAIDFVHPYINAAQDVITKETGADVQPGKLTLKRAPAASDELAVLVGVAGQLQGAVILMMPLATAFNLAERMIGEPSKELDDMVRSAIAEMTNVISGQAGVDLATRGRETSVSPPTVFVGRSDQLSTLSIPLVTVPFDTSCGRLELQVALKEAA